MAYISMADFDNLSGRKKRRRRMRAPVQVADPQVQEVASPEEIADLELAGFEMSQLASVEDAALKADFAEAVGLAGRKGQAFAPPPPPPSMMPMPMPVDSMAVPVPLPPPPPPPMLPPPSESTPSSGGGGGYSGGGGGGYSGGGGGGGGGGDSEGEEGPGGPPPPAVSKIAGIPTTYALLGAGTLGLVGLAVFLKKRTAAAAAESASPPPGYPPQLPPPPVVANRPRKRR